MKGLVLSISTLSFLLGCAIVEPTIKPASPTRPTYGQILKENYKGPKARVAVIRFVDKSARGKEMSQVGDGMAEMVRHALLGTNRYIVQVRRSSDDLAGDQDLGNGSRANKDMETDLVVEGEIREFKPGIPGAGDETGGASYVTVVVTMADPRTKQILTSEKVRIRASEFGGSTGRAGGPLPEVFKGFSKTLMEKAIRMTVEESASIIVAKTPLDCYRVVPAVAQKETPKPPPVSQKAPPPPPLRTTKVAWDSVNLREGPGTGYKVIGTAKKGTFLKILEANGDWLHVRLENGRTGWVSILATSEAPKPSPSAASVLPTPM
ncbi:MAG TPA: SH3 domain-containing protein [Thermodesulfobacteriota bacterium]|nr:SH3 domain-containing protein [Thermodesulfobacteriota bacterium]